MSLSYFFYDGLRLGVTFFKEYLQIFKNKVLNIWCLLNFDFSVLPCFRIGRSSLVSRKTFWLGPSPQMDRTSKRWRRLHTNSYHVFTSLSLSIPVRINDNNFRFNFVQIVLFFLKGFCSNNH